MTAPSWLPAWPSHWPDFEESFARWVPAEWPKRLWRLASNGYNDTLSVANIMAQTRKTLEWVLETVWPWLDTNELFLKKWEEVFGTWNIGSGIPKYAWLTALMRLRKNMDYAGVRSILIAAFGTLDGPENIRETSPTIANLPTYVATGYVGSTTDIENFYAKHQNMVHYYYLYPVTPIDPDQALFLRLSNLIKPTWQHWTVGRSNIAYYAAKVASDVAGTKTITAACNVCAPTVTNGIAAADVITVADQEVVVDAVNIGGDAKVFSVTTWPWAATVVGKFIAKNHGRYSASVYGS